MLIWDLKDQQYARHQDDCNDQRIADDQPCFLLNPYTNGKSKDANCNSKKTGMQSLQPFSVPPFFLLISHSVPLMA